MPRARDVGHQEARARQRRMGQREAGIGLHGARQMGRVAVPGGQHAVAPGDIGVTRSLDEVLIGSPYRSASMTSIPPQSGVERAGNAAAIQARTPE